MRRELERRIVVSFQTTAWIAAAGGEEGTVDSSMPQGGPPAPV
jgi:hypothetical protein